MKTNHTYEIKAVPTEYRGCLFRSRLEASWAAFFDLCEWDWQYEPFEMSGWTPDFLLAFKTPTLVEVKPTDAQCRDVIENLASFKDPSFELLVVGSGVSNSKQLCDYRIGSLSQLNWDGEGHYFAEAPVYVCGKCQRPTITHAEFTYSCRLNGCYDGDHYLSGGGRCDFIELWNRATRATRLNFPKKDR